MINFWLATINQELNIEKSIVFLIEKTRGFFKINFSFTHNLFKSCQLNKFQTYILGFSFKLYCKLTIYMLRFCINIYNCIINKTIVITNLLILKSKQPRIYDLQGGTILRVFWDGN